MKWRSSDGVAHGGGEATGFRRAIDAASIAAAKLRLTFFPGVRSGSAPEVFDVGALSGDRTFEFVVNAGTGGPSSALLGSIPNGQQVLKFEQYPDTLVIGLTDFGVADYNSAVPSPAGVPTHVAFTSDGTLGTDLYVGGVYRETFPSPLRLAGEQGLGGAFNADGTFFDPLDGMILSFASYDAALSPQEIADPAAAFAVPEPASAALLGLGGLGLLDRRQPPAGAPSSQGVRNPRPA